MAEPQRGPQRGLLSTVGCGCGVVVMVWFPQRVRGVGVRGVSQHLCGCWSARQGWLCPARAGNPLPVPLDIPRDGARGLCVFSPKEKDAFFGCPTEHPTESPTVLTGSVRCSTRLNMLRLACRYRINAFALRSHGQRRLNMSQSVPPPLGCSFFFCDRVSRVAVRHPQVVRVTPAHVCKVLAKRRTGEGFFTVDRFPSSNVARGQEFVAARNAHCG